MYCVGLTGSIASGKSSVSALFAKHGIEVISADHISRTLTLPGQPAFASIVVHFGRKILTATGTLDRRLLRHIIFNDSTQRQWLEQLLHPLIRAHIIQAISCCHSPYCMIEIPLLVERTHYPYLNRVLVILAPYEQRLQRLIKRDHCTKKQALKILAVQADDAAYQAIADDVLINDGHSNALETKVLELQKKYFECTIQTNDDL